jgi:hypothetical protein
MPEKPGSQPQPGVPSLSHPGSRLELLKSETWMTKEGLPSY